MRILFVTANRVGDAVLSSGVLAYLTQQYRDARVTIAAGPAAASLFRNAPFLEDLIVLEKQRFGFHWIGLWRHNISTKWDIVVDLRRSALAYLLRANKRYILPRQVRDIHRVELLATTLNLDYPPPAPAIWPDYSGNFVPIDEPVLALAPATNWIGKQWRPERFSEIALRLTSSYGLFPNAKIAIFAAASERAQVRQVLETIPKNQLLDLVGVGDLATVGGCLKECDFFIGNDAGLMHIAAAANIPTLGLFGPSRTEHYAPWGEKCAFIRTPKSYDELIGVPGYDHRTTDTLMDSLSVDAVEIAVKTLWQSTNGKTK